MDFDSVPSQGSGEPLALNPPPTPPPNSIFHNEKGLRPVWRLLIYLPLALVAYTTVIFLLTIFGPPQNIYSVRAILLFELALFAGVYGPALFMASIEDCSSGAYGLPLSAAFRKQFWQGMFLGLCEISALVGVIALFGGYSFGEFALHGAKLIDWAALWLLASIFIGLAEEFMFRGYVQYTLADGIGFWPAAFILSALFGYLHLSNKGENPVGALSVFATGLLFAFALRRTGNLWLAVGWHAAFDFGESFLFSVPNSGGVFEGHLSDATMHGAAWLTGGSVGPEGSVFSFITMGLGALVIHFWFPAKAKATPSQVSTGLES
jgi:membrane protease YdiL (CAAX protease family)